MQDLKPASFNAEGPSSKIGQSFVIINQLGRQVRHGLLDRGGQVDISELSPGLYFLYSGVNVVYKKARFIKL